MATKKQIDANRQNALKSTGPQTAAGKTASSRNAATHGLFARDVVAVGEDRKLFDTLLEALVEEHQPASVTEALIVERIALAFWREKRLARAEKLMMDSMEQAQKLRDSFDVSGGRYTSRPELVANNLAAEGMLSIKDQLLIGRYQTMISNQVRQAVKDLRDERSWREKTIDAAPHVHIANDEGDGSSF